MKQTRARLHTAKWETVPNDSPSEDLSKLGKVDIFIF